MKLCVLFFCTLIAMFAVSPAAAETYQISIVTNANQEEIIRRTYTRDCKAAIAESQPALAGCTAECVCTPILSEKTTYLRDVLVNYFIDARMELLRRRGNEVAVKYPFLTNSQRTTIDGAADLEPW